MREKREKGGFKSSDLMTRDISLGHVFQPGPHRQTDLPSNHIKALWRMIELG